VCAWSSWAGRRAALPEPALAELPEAVDEMLSAIDDPDDLGPTVDAYLAGLDLEGMQPEELTGVLEGRMFTMPYSGTRIGDEEFPFLAPGNPDDRGMLIEGEHPESHEARADPDSDSVDGTNPACTSPCTRSSPTSCGTTTRRRSGRPPSACSPPGRTTTTCCTRSPTCPSRTCTGCSQSSGYKEYYLDQQWYQVCYVGCDRPTFCRTISRCGA
jgi:hypothetical protein